ncbi:hypothetical protein [Spirochaeta cellobiosiphila]|uniref:hypothetical protein n=1 Tax=Spirochaeta cellobiosiphila TaxID=504483 RepID=UPI000421B4E0|nr:hypothetical protein [Spirochaeta cellobiosiphila]
MADQDLINVLDFILNRADSPSIEAIEEALKRRKSNLTRIGSIGVSPQKAAKQLAGQLESSLNQTRNMLESSVKRMAIDVIRKEAPELTDEQISMLLEEWIPNEDQRQKRDSKAMEAKVSLNPDMFKKMISDFLSFSTGKMSASYRIELENQIPGWTDVYWQKFPLRVRKLIRLYLDGSIDADSFWAEVAQSLGE